MSSEKFPVCSASGAVTKTGAGTLRLDRLPEGVELNVAEGTLAASTAGQNGGLVHRWSFNGGDLTDSVGGKNATFGGTVAPTCLAKSVTLPGGKNGTSYLNLGADILPKAGAVTVELWASQDGTANWGYHFNVGSSTTDRITLIGRCSDKNISANMLHGGWDAGNCIMAEMTVGVVYHEALVLVPNGDGTMVGTAYLQNAATGVTIAKTRFEAPCTIADVMQNIGWLGHSPYSADNDPAATFDEVRVWNRAFTEAELSRSAKLGPDRLIPVEQDGATVVESVPPTVAATDLLAHRWSFNGDWTDSIGVQNATAVTADGGTVTLADGKATIDPNNTTQGKNYIDLGANVLPKDRTPITIEVWGTFNQEKNWSHLLCFDNGTANAGLVANFRKGAGSNGTSICCLGVSDKDPNYETGKPAAGQEFYYAVVIVPDAAGGTAVTAYSKKTDGTAIGKYGLYYPSWNIYSMNLTRCYLGASKNWADPDAYCSFNEVRIWKCGFSEAELAEHAILGPDTLPEISDPADTGNVLPENPDATLVANNYLTHRWPFNGTLADVVGGQNATIGAGTPTWSMTAVTMPGGANGKSYLDIGPNALPTTGPVTVEFWVSQDVFANWGYLFEVGASQTDRVSIFGTISQTARESAVCVTHASQTDGNFPLSVMPSGVMYHLALVFTPAEGGGMDVTAYQQDALTGRTIAKTAIHTAYRLADIAQTHGWLGRSPYSSDGDPAATYDELRIWNAALSEAQLTRNAQLGPDLLPRINPAYNQPVGGDVNVSAGALLDLGGATLNVQSISGAGTVANGTANVIGTLSPGGEGTVGTLTLGANMVVKGTLKLDRGDLLASTGDLDLRGATIDFAPPADGQYGCVFATSSKLGGIQGPVASSNLPSKCLVKISDDGRRAIVINLGLIITIR